MPRGRLARYVAIGGGLAVVLAVGVAAFLSLQTPFQPASGGFTSAPCTPKPCANVRGYILWVGDVKIDSGLVTMNLTFRNSSAATHADPADLQLIDSAKNSTSAVYEALGCTRWPRTDFNNGAGFGPVPECFRPASTTSPLTLRWSPDLGFFCCQTDITIG